MQYLSPQMQQLKAEIKSNKEALAQRGNKINDV